eukprot:1157154-Pelagomonas_calceolata.AAC.3
MPVQAKYQRLSCTSTTTSFLELKALRLLMGSANEGCARNEIKCEITWCGSWHWSGSGAGCFQQPSRSPIALPYLQLCGGGDSQLFWADDSGNLSFVRTFRDSYLQKGKDLVMVSYIQCNGYTPSSFTFHAPCTCPVANATAELQNGKALMVDRFREEQEKSTKGHCFTLKTCKKGSVSSALTARPRTQVETTTTCFFKSKIQPEKEKRSSRQWEHSYIDLGEGDTLDQGVVNCPHQHEEGSFCGSGGFLAACGSMARGYNG